MYQKVKVQQEIDVQKRDKFWSKSEVHYYIDLWLHCTLVAILFIK